MVYLLAEPVGPAWHQFPFSRFNSLRTQERATQSALPGLYSAPCGRGRAKVRTEPARLIV